MINYNSRQESSEVWVTRQDEGNDMLKELTPSAASASQNSTQHEKTFCFTLLVNVYCYSEWREYAPYSRKIIQLLQNLTSTFRNQRWEETEKIYFFYLRNKYLVVVVVGWNYGSSEYRVSNIIQENDLHVEGRGKKKKRKSNPSGHYDSARIIILEVYFFATNINIITSHVPN
jgi:hypothetical protein